MTLTYLLILFVIAVALAPLSHFVPSKRQREIARMREYAAVHGLFVEFRSLPGGPGRRLQARNEAGQETIYYGKRLPPAKRKGEKKLAWLHESEGWRSLGQRLSAPVSLAPLPGQVLAASVDESSCGVYWCEAGGVELVEQIRQVLEAWSMELRG